MTGMHSTLAETGFNDREASRAAAGAALDRLPLWRAALSGVAALALFAALDLACPGHLWLPAAGFVAASFVPLTYWFIVARRQGDSWRGVLGEVPTWKQGRWVVLTTVTVLGVRFGWFSLLTQLHALPEVEASSRLWSNAAAPGRNVLLLLAGVVLAPSAEELLFRGILFRRLLRRMGALPAALVSSVLFGALHADHVGATLLALALMVLYAETGSLWASIAAHALSNLAVILVEWTRVIPDSALSSPWLAACVVVLCVPWLAWALQRGIRKLRNRATPLQLGPSGCR